MTDRVASETIFRLPTTIGAAWGRSQAITYAEAAQPLQRQIAGFQRDVARLGQEIKGHAAVTNLGPFRTPSIQPLVEQQQAARQQMEQAEHQLAGLRRPDPMFAFMGVAMGSLMLLNDVGNLERSHNSEQANSFKVAIAGDALVIGSQFLPGRYGLPAALIGGGVGLIASMIGHDS